MKLSGGQHTQATMERRAALEALAKRLTINLLSGHRHDLRSLSGGAPRLRGGANS